MRIVYHHRTQGEEPESIHIDAIVQALVALGHEVRIVGPAPISHRPSGQARPTLLGRIKRAVPRPVFELMQIGYNVVAYLRLRRAVIEFKPDFIYERYALFGFAGVLLARRMSVPVVLEVNTPYAQAWAQYFGLYFRRIAQYIERRTLQAAARIITVTHVQRGMLARIGVPSERVSVCHNAIDPDWFHPQRHTDPGLRERLGLRGVVIGFVGTMNRWQGMPEFRGVIQTVIESGADVSFLLVGDGEFRAQLEDFCNERGFGTRVVFTGRKRHAEIPPLIAAMDVAVLLNSNNYGSPMKIFEYLGMAKAVVAPSVDPVLEVLEDGRTGMLIEPGDGAQMAQRILQLVQDDALRERLGMAGRAYVETHHTWRANAQAVIDAYRNVGAS